MSLGPPLPLSTLFCVSAQVCVKWIASTLTMEQTVCVYQSWLIIWGNEVPRSVYKDTKDWWLSFKSASRNILTSTKTNGDRKYCAAVFEQDFLLYCSNISWNYHTNQLMLSHNINLYPITQPVLASSLVQQGRRKKYQCLFVYIMYDDLQQAGHHT